MESQGHQNQVLHVRGDSDTQMENLFEVLKQGQNKQTPFRNRNLPESFFKQPSRPSHSREGSQDSTNFNPLPPVARVPGQPASHPGLPINHGRSQSSPAQLPLPLSAAPPPTQHQHNKQNSVDFAEEMSQLRIPSGPWDLKQSPQRYFTNSQEQLSWPKSLSTNTLSAGAGGNHTPQGTLSPAHPSSPSVSLQNLGPLPQGWEQGVTPEGEVYFINHIDRTTSWFDPRLPKHLQKPGPIRLVQALPNAPIQGVPQAVAVPAPALQVPRQPTPGAAVTQKPPLAAAPQPQSQLGTPQQLSPQQQQQQISAPPAAGTPTPNAALRLPTATPTPTPAAQNSGGSSNQNPQFIQVELERLKQEKDRLQREQEEIGKRELQLKELMSVPKPEPQHSPAPPPTSIQSVSTSGIDPFLGQASTNMEAHARQNSGDSGLGGMGTSYSLPRTPEDFLSNVDDMDMQENKSHMMKPQSSDFNMNDLQNTVCSMDVGTLGDSEQTGMEEDLVPSLQEDISSLSSDLLDVDKMETLLWL